MKKEDKGKVIQYLEDKVEEVVGEVSKLMSTGISVRRTERESCALGTYADVLQGFLNAQEENELGIINNEISIDNTKTHTKAGRDRSLQSKQERPLSTANLYQRLQKQGRQSTQPNSWSQSKR